ncbi:hypothetical protein HW561_11080 [Rhodobacteraceae bacterium B1Z28]|uniref:Uncharacterized protein n=1 Tax=Ruegeria haliotis TaxID=2747601 RepID=A0ABX2PRW8_9RHOB|nr:hypothetical protein [Ruegeria haliotis]NVO56332.1 hypothetical protein [Ruegeria haliotis]
MSYSASGSTGTPVKNPQAEFDDFERGLLPVMRHFILSFAEPETLAWQQAYSIAIERWGQDQGLNLAHLVFKIVKATLHCRPEGLAFNDPLCVDYRLEVTCDERALLKMVHHMRRDETPAARDAVGQITGGYPDAHLIQAGLTLANRFPTGSAPRNQPPRRPVLRVIK